MELFDGHLFVHLNLGTGAAKVRASRKPLNDGNWHRVELTLKNKVGRITVDGNTEAFESPGEYQSNWIKKARPNCPNLELDDGHTKICQKYIKIWENVHT